MSTAPNRAAAPVNELDQVTGHIVDQHMGLTAREHAAIALRVPESGNEWLDKMIRTAQRNDLAALGMPVLMANMAIPSAGDIAMWAYKHADAMLAASESQSDTEIAKLARTLVAHFDISLNNMYCEGEPVGRDLVRAVKSKSADAMLSGAATQIAEGE